LGESIADEIIWKPTNSKNEEMRVKRRRTNLYNKVNQLFFSKSSYSVWKLSRTIGSNRV